MSARSMSMSFGRQPAHRAEQRQYRRIYLASFGLFLAVALLKRLAGGGGRGSVLTDARETAHATLGFAFMC